ncbi:MULTISPECIES: transcriptional regulator [Rodentibacter]|uniref:Transcriptional regulator n=2 Tax=Rodentibacter TaxID=1960084 RepID=A0A1V3IPC6_9PAST|nr:MULTISPECIES: transcriptional regulator [Rodentibacter]OOF37925.1 transcriptional regulator [Rodentibacter rarus]OOF44122.1 transcriptional regulator [Rodentibacter rarus]OOF45295.1 transcriptional regulator [Rodentibacter trehalosifermentans]OOF47483.1 transcriptional regulator [Rodentibacter trehalosifermentans]OOF53158.1 transcriptional regulator [Rodentibacter trehalosifermentans]
MKIQTEKQKFAARLHLALSAAGLSHLKTSEIATKFNLQHPNESVTQQAVHKWLNGLAIPSLDKIETLGVWLKVEPKWLRYGGQETLTDPLDEALMSMITKLTAQQKTVLINLISVFRTSNES